MKRQTILLLVFSFLLIGMAGSHNEKYGEILAQVILLLWLIYLAVHIIRKRIASVSISQKNNLTVQKPTSVTPLSASPTVDTVSSQLLNNPVPYTNPNQQRPAWVKVIGLINAILLIFGFQYIAIAPLATFIGLAFSGQDAEYVLLLFIISSIGSLCFIVFGIYSVVLAFGKKYNDNFSRTSKTIMFVPLLSCMFAGVFMLDLLFPSIPFTHQANKEDVVYVDKQKISRSEFQVISQSPYAIRNGEVYVRSCFDCSWTEYKVMPGVATSTFSILFNEFARDHDNIYLRGQLIPNTDPTTFELLESGIFGGSIWRDKDSIFIGTQILSDNPDSFKNFLNSRDYKYFGLDQSVYLGGKIIEGADRDTFRVISHSFSADDTRVFCAGRTIEGADPKTFVTFETKDVTGESIAVYGKDSTYAYFCSPYAGRRIVRIEEVDVASFDANGMKQGYAKDKYREYYFSGVSYEEEKTPYKVTIY